jgi:tetrahydromethanopterin S-methyltransferase subunit G
MVNVTVTPEPIPADNIERKVREYVQSLEQKLSKEVNAILDELLAEARRRVPVEEGDLKASGRKVKERGELHGYVVFGGKDAPHAAYVHEILTYHHDQGEAKYLENAVDELRGEAVQRIATLVGRDASFSLEFRMVTRSEEDKFK